MLRADVTPFLLRTTVTSPTCRRHKRVLYTQKVLRPLIPGGGAPGCADNIYRQMGHQVFDGFILDCFPRPGNGEHKAPAPHGIIRIALADHLHILLGAIGGVPRHNHPLGPRRGTKWLTISRNNAFSVWYAGWVWAESGEKHDRGNDSSPMWRSTARSAPPKTTADARFAPLLGHRILRPRRVSPPSPKIQCAILGRWQGVEGFLDPPLYQQMDIPIGCLEDARKRQAVIEPGVQWASSSKVFRPGCRACMKTSQQRRRRWRLFQMPGIRETGS